MHLSQLKSGGVVAREGAAARLIPGASIYPLASEAVASGRSSAGAGAGAGAGPAGASGAVGGASVGGAMTSVPARDGCGGGSERRRLLRSRPTSVARPTTAIPMIR